MKEDILQSSDFSMYIKFDGPEANKWEMDIEKAGKTLVAFGRLFRKYAKDCKKEKDWNGIIKINWIKTGSTELSLIAEIAKETIETGWYIFWGLKTADYLWIKDFCQAFMKTLGEQLALKIFTKNKIPEQWKIEWTKIYLINSQWDKQLFEYQSWIDYQILTPYFNDLYNLEAWKEDTMKLGFKEWDNNIEVAEITTEYKEYFSSWDNWWKFLDRLEEDFDEKNTVERRITWVFVDYYGLAHKYHFSFQARKNQDEIWKQKILCIVDNAIISQAIDYLKPENSRNITIFWNAVLDSEWKVDKIKIKWISNDPNFNPDQITLT